MEETKTIELSERFFKLTAALIILVAVFLLGELFYQFTSLPQNAPHEISVAGEGKSYAKPDVAMVSLGVTSQAAKSQDAVNKNNEKMNAIIGAIKGLGIEDKDIQTTLYNLYPIYGQEPVVLEGGVFPIPPYPGNDKIVSYRLEQQVQVKIRNFDKINDVLDRATANGANTVGSLQFTVDDMEKVRAEAREKAIKQAKEKAKTLVNQAGLRIQRLVNIAEGYSGGPASYVVREAFDAKESSVAPSIQTGQLEIDTTVTLTYRVQ